jgi:hypothetical protein
MSKIPRTSILSNIQISDEYEERAIEEALTTPYDKVIKILNQIKSHLNDTLSSDDMVRDLEWVIQRITSHKLYTYEMSDSSMEFDKMSKNSREIKTFFEYLNSYSQNTDRRGAKGRTSKTILVKEKIDRLKLAELSKSKSPQKKSTFNFTSFTNTYFKLENTQTETSIHKDSKVLKSSNYKQADDISPINRKVVWPKIIEKDEKLEECSIFLADDDENFLNKLNDRSEIDYFHPDLPNYCILAITFDLFDYEMKVGRKNVIMHGSLAIMDSLDLTKLVSIDKLDNFLENVRDNYLSSSPYHNDLHGFDVCQTVSAYLYHSDISGHLKLDDYDILAMIISALIHDVGHPGTNNTYQINTMSDLAFTYNDKSVLENYHVSLGFKILKKPECNIFEGINISEFKHIRKRIIECILSTDMTFHAKCHSTVKNRCLLNNIKDGENVENIIDRNSKNFEDDQQEIINFMIHCADISHNSKEFKISSQWTYLLMEEFWNQGDNEKHLGLPISFLCDRQTANVPSSQIGFITGIIIPSFETLVNLMPELNYYLDCVYININKWKELANENKVNSL